jgi:hypothetical protein
MKNLYITILALFSVVLVQAQQFTFDVYFEDAVGNRDTITLGYDATASDTINAQYGEINIVNQAWDSVFEVRLSEFDYINYSGATYNPSFQSKKKIMRYTPQPPCVYSSTPVFIAVKNKYRPFHFTWDSTLFQDTVRMSSGFQFYHYVCPGPIWASSTDSLMYEDPFNYCEQCHIEQNGDTIWLIGFAFSYFNTIGFQNLISEDLVVKAYPNPVKDIVTFDMENINQESELFIYNSLGQLIKKEQIASLQKDYKINISNYKSGIYYYQITLINSQEKYSGKFVKL